MCLGRDLGLLSRPLLHLGVSDNLLDDFLVLLPAIGVLPPYRALVLTVNTKMLAGAADGSGLVAFLPTQATGETA